MNSQNQSASNPKENGGKKKSAKTEAHQEPNEQLDGKKDTSVSTKLLGKGSMESGSKTGSTTNFSNADLTDLKESIIESMKFGFNELASVLKSAPCGSKRPALDSDSENSSSEIRDGGLVSRPKKQRRSSRRELSQAFLMWRTT